MKITFKNISLITYFVIASLVMRQGIIDKFSPASTHGDFLNFYTGGTLWNSDKENLYRIDKQKEIQNEIVEDSSNVLAFRSLPFVASAFSHLAKFSFSDAALIFFVVNLAIIVVLPKIYNYKNYLYGLILSLAFYPTLITLYNSQISLVTAALYGLGLFAQSRKYCFLGGLLISVLWIKPQFLVMLPLLFVTTADLNEDTRSPELNKKSLLRFIAGFVVGTIVLLFVVVFPDHFKLLERYPAFLLNTESIESGTHPDRLFSMQAIVHQVTRNGYKSISIILNIFLYLGFAIVFIMKRNSYTEQKKVLLVSLSGVLFAWHAFIYDYIIVIAPLFGLINTKDSRNFWIFFLIPITTLFGYGSLTYAITLIYTFMYATNTELSYNSNVNANKTQ